MKKELLALSIGLMLLIISFSGCAEQKDKTNEPIDYNQIILGTWIHYPDPTKGEGAGLTKYTFRSNNSAYYSIILWGQPSGAWMQYNITEEKLTISLEVGNFIEGSNFTYSHNYSYSFSDDNKNLNLGLEEEVAIFIKQEPRGILTIEEVIVTTFNIYLGENITVEGYYNSTLESIVSTVGELISALPIELSDISIPLQENIRYRFTGMLVSDFSDSYVVPFKLLAEKIELV